MVQKYYNVREVSQLLGIGEEEVKEMQTRRELFGYRDGATWKFKVEDIERKVRERQSPPAAAPPEDEGDVLLSEVELGASDPGASGTVIAMGDGGAAPTDSDIRLGGDSDLASASQKIDIGSKVAQFEELDLALEDDLTLDDAPAPAAAPRSPGGSDIDLAGKELDDDDVVLGGSGAGSDITIGGDSGISLVDPADSGLSLEEPLDLAGSGAESLQLGEDDMLATEEEGAPAGVKADDDFLLTPLEETAEADDSESGSQVIALDTGADEAATMISSSSPGRGTMAAMLDEDLSAGPAASDLGLGAGLEAASGAGLAAVQPTAFAQGAPVPQPGAVLPEAPYTGLNITSLALCVFLLLFCGMFTYDLLRNMWSFDSPFSVNSAIMDWILGLFG